MGKLTDNILTALQERILVLDGAMGTLIQKRALKEQDFASGVFKKVDKGIIELNNFDNVLKSKEVIKNLLK